MTPALFPMAPSLWIPSALVLHYAQEIFEGLKAFRQEDGSVVAFQTPGQYPPLQPQRPPHVHAGSGRRVFSSMP